MSDDPQTPEPFEPETDSTEPVEDEAPTEDQEATASDTQASELATVELLAGEVEELRARAAECGDLFEKLQRSKADFINYQKRVQRERERWGEMAIRDFALRLLPVLDDLERALHAARQNHDVEALTHGIELIQSKLLKALATDDIVPFDAQGERFDPAFHEAVAHLDDPDVPDQTVREVVQMGYMIGDRVLRAAQVVVARGGPPAAPPAEAALPEADEDDTEDVQLQEP